MAKRERKRSGLDAEGFIKVWQRGKSLDEIAEKTGMDRLSVSRRAGFYRKKGITLQVFRGGGRAGLDIDALNKVAAEAAK